MRTLIDLPDSDVEALDQIGERRQMSRAKVVRQAVREFLQKNVLANRDEAFGLWRDRDVDGLEYQRRLREEW